MLRLSLSFKDVSPHRDEVLLGHQALQLPPGSVGSTSKMSLSASSYSTGRDLKLPSMKSLCWHIPKAVPKGGDNWLVLQLLASVTGASS